jgi:hypothetical protein
MPTAHPRHFALRQVGLPTVLLFDSRGRLLDRVEGVVDPAGLLERLREVEERCRTSLACR